MSRLGSFLITSCLAGVVLSMLVLNPLDPPDVAGLGDGLTLVLPLSMVGAGGAIAERQWWRALAALVFQVVAGMVVFLLSLFLWVLPWLWTPSRDLNVLSGLIFVLSCAALAGAVAVSGFRAVPRAWRWGAAGGILAAAILALLTWSANKIWPPQFTELEPAAFVALLGFGPTIGIVLGWIHMLVRRPSSSASPRSSLGSSGISTNQRIRER